MEMRLVPSGSFYMGSVSLEASPHEQPVSHTYLSRFYMSRCPVTNAQYERFDPKHRAKRASWADDNHPVVYVTSVEAINFCHWLTLHEKRKYRLPTEAEWEYAARGMDGRNYPWGERLDRGDLANFADKHTSFPWRDPVIDDGWAESSPVGTYPRGASPFGIEDMAGNVWEWCLDFFELYKGKERSNPRGPMNGAKRVYRGGSWKSRIPSLRTTARGFNLPNYSSNDVGFRIVCECE
jgi:formylglycine-generating enzyme required for sulfatase activity